VDTVQSVGGSQAVAQPQPITFDPALVARGLTCALCLLAVSSRSGTPWLGAIAVAVALYTLYVGAPAWRLVSLSKCLAVISLWPHVAAFLGASATGVILADAPYTPLAALGSLMIIILLAVLGTLGALLMARGVKALFPALRAWCSGGLHSLRLYATLFGR
jgi:hypothetical protein